MMMTLNLLLMSAALVQGSVDEAITLYDNGDIPGAIDALESLVHAPYLSFDEQLRAWDRLGSAYFAMGRSEDASLAYLELLKLDVHYDLSPSANPRLRALLGLVRDESMASAVVVTVPEGALITLDNELMGVTPMTLEGLLAGGEYSISVYSDGYEGATLLLAAQAGQVHQIRLDMVPLTADINEAIQPWADSSGHSQDLAYIFSMQETDFSGVEDIETPASTADLVNILTSGGGFDMAALASSGALSSQRASTGIAGAERIEGFQLASGLPIEVLSSEDLQSTMVFSGQIDGVSQDAQPDGETVPGSSRTGEEIMEVLNEKRTAVSYIYNKHLRNDPMLMGTVLIEMVIEPSGRVSSVNILGSNTYNPAFELELARQIETWRFGAMDENEDPLTVQYPFTFSQ